MAGKYTKHITAHELKDRLEAGEKLHILDVREEEEWAAGHIPGAVHIPLGALSARHGELDKRAAHMVICLSGGRSGLACEYLEEIGYEVSNVAGGMSRWDGPVQYGI